MGATRIATSPAQQASHPPLFRSSSTAAAVMSRTPATIGASNTHANPTTSPMPPHLAAPRQVVFSSRSSYWRTARHSCPSSTPVLDRDDRHPAPRGCLLSPLPGWRRRARRRKSSTRSWATSGPAKRHPRDTSAEGLHLTPPREPRDPPSSRCPADHRLRVLPHRIGEAQASDIISAPSSTQTSAQAGPSSSPVPTPSRTRQRPIARAFGANFCYAPLPDWEPATAYQAALRLPDQRTASLSSRSPTTRRRRLQAPPTSTCQPPPTCPSAVH